MAGSPRGRVGWEGEGGRRRGREGSRTRERRLEFRRMVSFRRRVGGGWIGRCGDNAMLVAVVVVIVVEAVLLVAVVVMLW